MLELATSRDHRFEPLRFVLGNYVVTSSVLVYEVLRSSVPFGEDLFDHRCQVILECAPLILRALVKNEATDRHRCACNPPAVAHVRKTSKVIAVTIAELTQCRDYPFTVRIKQEHYRVLGHFERVRSHLIDPVDRVMDFLKEC